MNEHPSFRPEPQVSGPEGHQQGGGPLQPAGLPSFYSPQNAASSGLLAGLCAHLLWGVAVLFWPLLAELSAVSLLAHRMCWSCLFLLIILLLTRQARPTFAALRQGKLVGTLWLCSCMLCINWGVFLWAVNSGNVIETSLGYFITPLLNVLMGRVLLRERLSRLQGLAILLAFLAVAWGVVGYGHVPWVAFILAGTFAIYGYLQKTVRLGAASSLFLQTLFILPFAVAWLSIALPGEWGGLTGHGAWRPVLLICTIAFTGLPLLMFGYAARHISLASIGILQYVSPSINFLLAVLVQGEQIKPSDQIIFPIIWTALAIYTWDALHRLRAARMAAGRLG